MRHCLSVRIYLSAFIIVSVSMVAWGEPGISSPIKWVYVIGHTHLDIGFTDPAEVVAANQKTILDTQISYARTRSAYKWNIEETWTVDQWLKRSNQTEIDELTEFMQWGKFGMTAGHSTMHSPKLGFEQVVRLLWNAREYREQFGINVETLIHDDVPGITWSYPQVLARSGIKYLVAGQNLFIGGGFTQPYDSYPFYWEGPDGSKILTWSARNSYTEGFSTYGLPWLTNDPVNVSDLQNALDTLAGQGYPYDAVLVQQAFDNASITAHYNAIRNWNANNDNPKFILATPEEFFEYLVANYEQQIPTHSGNWTSIWDVSGVVEPKSEKIVKNSQDELLSTEKMWAIASALSLGSYPHSEFNTAWDMALTVDEHSGGGGGWPDYFTQEEVDLNNQQHYGYALSVQENSLSTRSSVESTLLEALGDVESESIVVFNSLSWSRTDLVRLSVPPTQFDQEFSLQRADTGTNVSYQKDFETGDILFVAKNVPPVGYARFMIVNEPPPAFNTSLSIDANTLQSSHYRLSVSEQGQITGIEDLSTGRQMIDFSSSLDFNKPVSAENLEFFFGVHQPVPDATVTVTTPSMNGPVAASLKIENAYHPLKSSELILYDQLDRMDIINTVDREQMQYASLDINSIYYALTFPFLLSNHRTRIDTPAGWLDPATQSLPGSYRGGHVIQHGVDISESDYGIFFSTPDVYTHSFGGFQTSWNATSVDTPTVFSTFIRYCDETDLVGEEIGYQTPEPGSSLQWDLHYSLRAHEGGFDPVRESRAGWEICTPLVARLVSPSGYEYLGDELSFFTVAESEVAIVSIKEADFGSGLILKIQELSGNPSSTATISSDYFGFLQVKETSPLEEDVATLLSASSGLEPTSFQVNLTGHEIKTLRLEVIQATTTPVNIWSFY